LYVEDVCVDAALMLSRIVGRLAEGCGCALLSGGIDTTFVLASLQDRSSVVAVTVDLGGPDAGYAALAASRLGVEEHVVVNACNRGFWRAGGCRLVSQKPRDDRSY